MISKALLRHHPRLASGQTNGPAQAPVVAPLPEGPVETPSLIDFFSEDRLKELVIPRGYVSKIFVLESFGTWDPDRSIMERIRQLIDPDQRHDIPFFSRFRYPLFPLALFRENTAMRMRDPRCTKWFGFDPSVPGVQSGLKFAFSVHLHDLPLLEQRHEIHDMYITPWVDWMHAWCPHCGRPAASQHLKLPYLCECGADCGHLASWIRHFRCMHPTIALLLSHIDDEVYRKVFYGFYEDFKVKEDLVIDRAFIMWLKLIPRDGPRCRRDQVSSMVREFWQQIADIDPDNQ